jgi:phosphohistidine phosphatase
MKVLLVLRHAKSSWKNPELPDHDRPLSNRGKKDAPRMGKLLVKEGLVPGIIISSPAMRARTTAEKVAKSSNYQGEIVIESSLYGSGHEAYLDVLKHQPDKYQTVLMVGHNPDIELLIQSLTGNEIRMPTCGLASVNLPVDKWVNLANGIKAELAKVWRPKELT